MSCKDFTTIHHRNDTELLPIVKYSVTKQTCKWVSVSSIQLIALYSYSSHDDCHQWSTWLQSSDQLCLPHNLPRRFGSVDLRTFWSVWCRTTRFFTYLFPQILTGKHFKIHTAKGKPSQLSIYFLPCGCKSSVNNVIMLPYDGGKRTKTFEIVCRSPQLDVANQNAICNFAGKKSIRFFKEMFRKKLARKSPAIKISSLERKSKKSY